MTIETFIDYFYKMVKDDTIDLVTKNTYVFDTMPYIHNDYAKALITDSKIFYCHPSILKSISICIQKSDRDLFNEIRKEKLYEWKGKTKGFYNGSRKEKLKRILNEE